MTSHDYRVLQQQRTERGITGLVDEIAASQVTKISLDEYQPGSPRLEALYRAMYQQKEVL